MLFDAAGNSKQPFICVCQIPASNPPGSLNHQQSPRLATCTCYTHRVCGASLPLPQLSRNATKEEFSGTANVPLLSLRHK